MLGTRSNAGHLCKMNCMSKLPNVKANKHATKLNDNNEIIVLIA